MSDAIEDGIKARYAAAAIARGDASPQVHTSITAGMTLKQYDRYLNLRIFLPPAIARAIAMGDQ